MSAWPMQKAVQSKQAVPIGGCKSGNDAHMREREREPCAEAEGLVSGCTHVPKVMGSGGNFIVVMRESKKPTRKCIGICDDTGS
jgi:hypothetical protein